MSMHSKLHSLAHQRIYFSNRKHSTEQHSIQAFAPSPHHSDLQHIYFSNPKHQTVHHFPQAIPTMSSPTTPLTRRNNNILITSRDSPPCSYVLSPRLHQLCSAVVSKYIELLKQLGREHELPFDITNYCYMYWNAQDFLVIITDYTALANDMKRGFNSIHDPLWYRVWLERQRQGDSLARIVRHGMRRYQYWSPSAQTIWMQLVEEGYLEQSGSDDEVKSA
ncbi:hypothetical protein EDC01DRAFT_627811 [Geopyxis carbonaria]|nr:hypothetical protein EDC01DRAFT_627811 [Geopyxis carbonaria]